MSQRYGCVYQKATYWDNEQPHIAFEDLVKKLLQNTGIDIILIILYPSNSHNNLQPLSLLPYEVTLQFITSRGWLVYSGLYLHRDFHCQTSTETHMQVPETDNKGEVKLFLLCVVNPVKKSRFSLIVCNLSQISWINRPTFILDWYSAVMKS
jgi:hypothetical protein